MSNMFVCLCLPRWDAAKASGRGGGVQVQPQRPAADLGLQGGLVCHLVRGLELCLNYGYNMI